MGQEGVSIVGVEAKARRVRAGGVKVCGVTSTFQQGCLEVGKDSAHVRLSFAALFTAHPIIPFLRTHRNHFSGSLLQYTVTDEVASMRQRLGLASRQLPTSRESNR